MSEETEYWETVQVLRTVELPAVPAEKTLRGYGFPHRLQVTFKVLESNKSFRVGDVHTVTVHGEYITRVLAAQAIQVRLVAHSYYVNGWHSRELRAAFYPVEHPSAP